jgi:predicted dehydrogenase
MVHATAVDGLKGGRLRVGMVGGGRNAFIGAVHRMAMRLDDLIELKAGALSSDAENARVSGADLGLATDRTCSDYREMARPDGVEAVVIVIRNHLHFPAAKAFLDAGIDVICDKPLSTTLAEASEFVALTRAKGLIFAVILNNTGYPMVRQAWEMIESGEIGAIRVVHAFYVLDWLTLPIDADGHKQAEWRTDPTRAGASACLADIGVHAHSLALFVTGLELEAASADLTTFVPGRRLDDNAHLLMRFAASARGVLAASQVAVGSLNNFAAGSNGQARSRRRSGPRPMASPFTSGGDLGNTPLAIEGSRMPGRPSGRLCRRLRQPLPRHGGTDFGWPRGAYAGKKREIDPERARRRAGVAFIEGAVKSSRNNGLWTSARFG